MSPFPYYFDCSSIKEMPLLVSADLHQKVYLTRLFVYFKFTAISVKAPKFVLCKKFGFFIFLNLYIKSHSFTPAPMLGHGLRAPFQCPVCQCHDRFRSSEAKFFVNGGIRKR